MEIIFGPQAKKDLKFWKESGNIKIQKRITELLTSISQTPFEGIGKPEPLKYNLAGSWSRRINDEHRLIYAVSGDIIEIYSIKGHSINLTTLLHTDKKITLEGTRVMQ